MVYQFYAKAHRPDALCSNHLLTRYTSYLRGSVLFFRDLTSTVSVLYLYSTYTLSILYLLYLYSICVLSIITLSVLYLYTSCTRSVLYLLYLYSICTVPVFYLYSIYTLSVLYLYFICTLSILYLVGYDRIEPRWDRMDKLRLRSAGIGVSWD